MQQIRKWLETALFWIGPALVLSGILIHRLWTQWPFGRMGELLLIALAVLAASKLSSRLLGWSTASVAALGWCLLLAVFAGILPVLATGLFCLAAAAVGGIIYPRGTFVLRGVLGALLIASMLGWLLFLPIHHAWTYLPLCLGLIAWQRRSLIDSLKTGMSGWSEIVNVSPHIATFAVLTLGLASTACWLPTLQFDDLAYHLRLPWQLQTQGFYSPEPQYQVWALAPWASDILHAIPQVISRHEARGPINAVWLAVGAAGVWRLAGNLGAPVASRWLAAALFASLPLTAALAGGMQTELSTGAVLVWLAAMIAEPRNGHFRFWLALAVLASGLMAIKLTSATMACILLLWALLRHPWPSPLRILALLFAGIGIAGASYVFAFTLAGNPVLPFLNGVFHSPYFAFTNMVDTHWNEGFNASLLWNMTFRTGQYMEIYDGGGGFLLIALSGIWLLSFFQRPLRAVAMASTAILLLPLIPMQYLRYAYPGFVLLSAVLVAAGSSQGRRFNWLLIGLCVLNLGFQANSHWMLYTGGLRHAIKVRGRSAPLEERFAPERIIAAQIRKSASTGNVLLLDPEQPMYAEFGSRGRTTSWYSPSMFSAATRANKDASGKTWLDLMQHENIGEVILRPKTATAAQLNALRQAGAVRKSVIANVEWWNLPEQRP